MKLNNISLPYPVLGVNDDILPGLPEDAVKMDLVSQNGGDYLFKLQLSFNNPQIEDYIKQGLAVYACEVDCRATLQRYSITSSSSLIDVKLKRNAVAGEIVFSSYITVVKPIPGYVNDGFNEDYEGCSFDMEPGDILVGFPVATFDVDLKYDKLQAAGAYMQIREEANKNYTNIELNDKTIDIKLPTELFQMYNSGLGQSFPEIMHASIAYSALVTALNEYQNDYERHCNSYWARAIRYRLETEEKLKELTTFSDDGVAFTDISLVASVLLNDPYNRMFNSLSNSIDKESISDE